MGPVPAKSRLRRHPQSLTTCERATPLKQRKLTRPLRAESRSRILESRLIRLSSTDHSNSDCARDPPLTGVGEGSNDSRKSTKSVTCEQANIGKAFGIGSRKLLRAPSRLRNSGPSQRAGTLLSILLLRHLSAPPLGVTMVHGIVPNNLRK